MLLVLFGGTGPCQTLQIWLLSDSKHWDALLSIQTTARMRDCHPAVHPSWVHQRDVSRRIIMTSPSTVIASICCRVQQCDTHHTALIPLAILTSGNLPALRNGPPSEYSAQLRFQHEHQCDSPLTGRTVTAEGVIGAVSQAELSSSTTRGCSQAAADSENTLQVSFRDKC